MTTVQILATKNGKTFWMTQKKNLTIVQALELHDRNAAQEYSSQILLNGGITEYQHFGTRLLEIATDIEFEPVQKILSLD